MGQTVRQLYVSELYRSAKNTREAVVYEGICEKQIDLSLLVKQKSLFLCFSVLLPVTEYYKHTP